MLYRAYEIEYRITLCLICPSKSYKQSYDILS